MSDEDHDPVEGSGLPYGSLEVDIDPKEELMAQNRTWNDEDNWWRSNF